MKQLRYRLFAIGSLLSLTSLVFTAEAQKKATAPKGVPQRLLQGLSCTTIEPIMNGLPKDTFKTRALSDGYFLWEVGKKVSVKFIDEGGSYKLRQKIKAAAKEWEKYANISFDFVESGDANIRVFLTDKGGCNSVVGIYALSVPANKHTMNIDTNFFHQNGVCYENYLTQTIQHEFGHAIGLLHEHFYKDKIQWNKEVVYKEALARNKDWDKSMVDAQIFRQSSSLYANGFMYDPKSIMHYGFPASWTMNNIEVKSNFFISPGDIETIGFLYPKSGIARPEVLPKFIVSDFTGTTVIKDQTRGGFIIYPSFNLATSVRTAKVIITVYMLDEKRKLVLNKMNPANCVAAQKGGELKPGTKLAVNKSGRNFELFIPFDNMPDGLTNYQMLLVVSLVDEVNGETKYIATDEVPYSQIK
jgi:serralysin